MSRPKKSTKPAVSAPVSTPVLCTTLGVHRKTVALWIKKGLPCVTRGRGKAGYTFDLAVVKAWIVACGLPSARTPGADPSQKLLPVPGIADAPRDGLGPVGGDALNAGNVDPDAAPATRAEADFLLCLQKIRKERYAADRGELALKVRQGELLERTEVEAQTIARILAVRAGLLALPGTLTPQLVGRGFIEIQQIIDEAVRRLLATFAGEGASEAPPVEGANA